MCVADDDSERLQMVREISADEYNGFTVLWYAMKTITRILDPGKTPERPVYKGSLSTHAGAWDVYCIRCQHRQIDIKHEECTMIFCGICRRRGTPRQHRCNWGSWNKR